jgi:uncharacterized protein YjbI with pentapeptide repeats
MSTNPPAPPESPSPAPQPPPLPASPSVSPPAVTDPDAVLKTRKLELEIKQLERANSKSNWILTLAPSLTALVAIVALAWTINSGTQQIRQTQNGQDQDRFDKALSRLGSASVSERLTGAAGLSLFFTADQRSRHAATLRFLATALVIEKDSSVRQAILDTFLHIDPAVVQQDAREDGLRTLLDLNRSALQVVVREKESSAQAVAMKSQDPDFENKVEGLRASGRAIVIFVKDGAAQRNFSGIDCTDCDFAAATTALDLSGSNFNHAILANSKFSGTRLSESSFEEADLAGTNFEGAILRNARFTGAAHNSYSVQQYQRSGDKPKAPNFACADMTGADFSGSLFFGVIESDTSNERVAGYPDLFQANLDGANLSHIGLYALPLARSKSLPPFANGKIISYTTQKAKSKYAVMHVVEAPDWRFVPSSPSFQQSWRYLQGQFQLASDADNANLPLALGGYRMVPQPPADRNAETRCEKYKHP